MIDSPGKEHVSSRWQGQDKRACFTREGHVGSRWQSYCADSDELERGFRAGEGTPG